MYKDEDFFLIVPKIKCNFDEFSNFNMDSINMPVKLCYKLYW